MLIEDQIRNLEIGLRRAQSRPRLLEAGRTRPLPSQLTHQGVWPEAGMRT